MVDYPPEVMLRLFGWSVWSPPGSYCRSWFVAAVAEQRNGHLTPDGFPLWDRTAKDLALIRRYGPDGPEPVPAWWALPWVTEDLVRLREDLYESLREVADA